MTTARLQQSGGASNQQTDAWLAPQFVMAMAPFTERVVTLPAGTRTVIALRNVRRIGLVFTTELAMVGNTYVHWSSDPSKFGLPITAADRFLTAAVDDLYSLIGETWYGYSATGGDILVTEFVRPAMGVQSVQGRCEDQAKD